MIKKFLFTLLVVLISAQANENIDKEFEQNQLKAQIEVKELLAKAMDDDSNAYLELGKIYLKNDYIQKDILKAMQYFSASYYLGNTSGAYNLALLYANDKIEFHNEKKALSIFLELARKGHAPSQNKVGMFLASGTVLEKDFKEAVKWFEMSSKQGFVDAQCNLAFMYATGQGVWQNMGRAHAFAKPGFEKGNEICKNVWEEYDLEKYPEDKGFKFKFYNEP